jgi:photosystem II stability/assembly factor-like uncharacterized protein
MLYVHPLRIALRHLLQWICISATAIILLFTNGFAFGQSGYYWEVAPNSPFTTNHKFDDIYFLDSLTGMACSGDGLVYRTTDAGITWNIVFSNSDAFFRCLVMTDAQHAWVGNFGYFPGASIYDSTAVYHTSDGGATWVPAPIPVPKPIGICGLSRVGTQHVYGVGRVQGPASFIRTTNGGTSWAYTDMVPYCGFLVDVHFTGIDTGFVIGGTDTVLAASVPLILHTVNGGVTWDTVHIGAQNAESWCWKMQFPSPNIGYASIESAQSPVQCLKTTDGGVTWTIKDITNTQFNCQGIGFVNDSVGWAGGYSGYNHYETTDGGDTWTALSFAQNLNRIRPLSSTLLWASGKRLYRVTKTPPVNATPPFPPQTLPVQFRRCTSGECVNVDLLDPDPLRVYELQLFDVVGRQIRTLPLSQTSSTYVSLEEIPNTMLYFVVTDGERWVCQLVVR